MAFTKAAVLKSTFLFNDVFITYSVADDIISSNPAYTMSLSVAPSKSRDLSKLDEGRPVAFEMTWIKLSFDFYSHFLCILPGRTWSKFFNHSK